jgi:hypothetical protein
MSNLTLLSVAFNNNCFQPSNPGGGLGADSSRTMPILRGGDMEDRG